MSLVCGTVGKRTFLNRRGKKRPADSRKREMWSFRRRGDEVEQGVMRLAVKLRRKDGWVERTGNRTGEIKEVSSHICFPPVPPFTSEASLHTLKDAAPDLSQISGPRGGKIHPLVSDVDLVTSHHFWKNVLRLRFSPTTFHTEASHL